MVWRGDVKTECDEEGRWREKREDNVISAE